MNAPIPQNPPTEKIDPKVRLEEARIRMANNRFNMKIDEAIIKKLEELAR